MKGFFKENGGRGFFPGCFKVGGLFLFAAALGVCIRGLAYRDPYEIVLAAVSLALWFAFFLAGLLGSKRLELLTPGWLVPVPLSAGGGEVHTVTGLDAKVPYFFRLHFIVKGIFFLSAGNRFLVSSEVTGGGGREASLVLNFPMSGIFHGRGFCCLRDVFGLFSFPCGPVLHRSLSVQPFVHHKKLMLRIDPFSGAEDRQSRSQTDEERYYMREYVPGDRFRDINWKSSERLDTLITRISPHTQEKTKLIHLVFRNYGPVSGAGLRFSWLLDRTKARLALFLRQLKGEHPEFIFHILTATDERTIQSTEEIEDFLGELAGMNFHQAAAGVLTAAAAAGTENGELYLFSTSCDTELPVFLVSRGENLSHLFITVPARRDSGDKAVFHARSVFTEGFLPVPGFLLRPRRFRHNGIRQIPSVPVPQKGSLEVTYAEVCL